MLETLRGVNTCNDKGWNKMTDPKTATVTVFQVMRHANAGFSPELFITLSAIAAGNIAASVQYGVTGYNQ